MPFAYYRRLSAPQKRIYDASARVTQIALPRVEPLLPLLAALEASLVLGKRAGVEVAARKLVHGLCDVLEVARPKVEVLAKRPRKENYELHGLYTREEGEHPVIQVWMKTAARRDVVAFRSFLRTLLHEALHHLDYVYLKLADSFHTEGFYQRESSLVRQLLGDSAIKSRRAGPRKPVREVAPKAVPSPRRLPVLKAESTSTTKKAPQVPRPDRASQLRLFE